MKTAIQQLIDKLSNSIKFEYRNELVDALEKEKEQIIQTWDKRGSTIVPRYFLEENITGEQYYNQTYNTKQHIIDIMKEDEDDGLYNQNK